MSKPRHKNSFNYEPHEETWDKYLVNIQTNKFHRPNSSYAGWDHNNYINMRLLRLTLDEWHNTNLHKYVCSTPLILKKNPLQFGFFDFAVVCESTIDQTRVNPPLSCCHLMCFSIKCFKYRLKYIFNVHVLTITICYFYFIL